MPKVSVIVAAFNCEPFVEAAIGSVSDQTEEDIEIIVVDDGSTDGTSRTVERLARQDSRIVVLSQENCGRAGLTRNRGLARASGEFIAFLDADDIYHQNKVRRQLEVFHDLPSADIVFHDFVEFTGESRGSRPYLRGLGYVDRARTYLSQVGGPLYACSPDFDKFMALDIVGLHTGTIMFRRCLLAQHTTWFRGDLSVGEDSDFWLRLVHGARVAYLDESLFFYRRRAGSLTTNSVERNMAGVVVHTDSLARIAAELTPEERTRYRRKIADCWFNLGYAHDFAGHASRARMCYVTSYLMCPGLGPPLAYLKTFLPLRTRDLLRGRRRSVPPAALAPLTGRPARAADASFDCLS